MLLWLQLIFGLQMILKKWLSFPWNVTHVSCWYLNETFLVKIPTNHRQVNWSYISVPHENLTFFYSAIFKHFSSYVGWRLKIKNEKWLLFKVSISLFSEWFCLKPVTMIKIPFNTLWFSQMIRHWNSFTPLLY